MVVVRVRQCPSITDYKQIILKEGARLLGVARVKDDTFALEHGERRTIWLA
jgi:hypothetical protein